MSTFAKVTFVGACAFTCGAVGYVHFKQIQERHLLHQGIVRDVDTQQKRKLANQHSLQLQIDITKRFKEQQQDSQLNSQDQQGSSQS